MKVLQHFQTGGLFFIFGVKHFLLLVAFRDQGRI